MESILLPAHPRHVAMNLRETGYSANALLLNSNRSLTERMLDGVPLASKDKN